MYLTDLQFRELIQLCQRMPAGRPPDKRRAPRANTRARAVIVPMESDVRAAAVEIRDLSARGVRVFHTQPIQAGEQFVLRFGSQASRDPLARTFRILCTVIHCRKTSDEMFCMGAEFTCVLGESRPQ